MSPWLTHFCDRARPTRYGVPEQITRLGAPERLAAILWEHRLRAFVTYSLGDPATCLTEASLQGLRFLMTRRSYQPWGLVFDRQSVFNVGGGPVWYARQKESEVVQRLDSRMRSWVVRLQPGSSDWLEEREWRIPRPADDGPEPAVLLTTLRPVALLVGDPNWAPSRPGWYTSPVTGSPEHGHVVPATIAGIPRWWWNHGTGEL